MNKKNWLMAGFGLILLIMIFGCNDSGSGEGGASDSGYVIRGGKPYKVIKVAGQTHTCRFCHRPIKK